jgi:hypothetical protein
MGLFKKIFSKESCILCGNEVGSLSRKRLGDETVICKDCAKRLSPFFDDFENSDAAAIKMQVADRQANVTRLATFAIDECYGFEDAVLIDRHNGQFCVNQGGGGITYESPGSLIGPNPDVVSVKAITSIEVEGAGWSCHEVKHSVNGEQVSYSPRRFEYPCNVTLVIRVDHPYIETMTARINRGTIHITTEGERLRNADARRSRTAGQATADWLLGRTVDVENSAETWADNSLEARLTRPVTRAFANPFTDMPDYAYGFKCSPENWHRIQEYDRCMQAAEAARFTLLELRG